LIFSGREKECKEMKELLHAVNSDDREVGLIQHMVVIESEAGIGKTRLMEQFMDIAEDENFK
jgi:predicted ATPase